MKAQDVGVVIAVSRSPTHTLSKENQRSIQLLAGLGVEGDAHMGEKVQHRYQLKKDPTQPNLCQVHLIHAELFDELRDAGIGLCPSQMGENITTRGTDLLGLPTGARLHLGETAIVEVTGLRTPCAQLNRIQHGLMAATRVRIGSRVAFKAGIMSIVIEGGEVRPGDPVGVELPAEPHLLLRPV